jgi:hypothetical protein
MTENQATETIKAAAWASARTHNDLQPNAKLADQPTMSAGECSDAWTDQLNDPDVDAAVTLLGSAAALALYEATLAGVGKL